MLKIFGLHDTDESIKSLQRLLNEKYNLDLTVDGNIGKITQAAIAKYQEDNGLNEIDEHGVCYGEKTQECAAPFIKNKYLNEQDFSYAANVLKVEVAAVKAFAKTESKEFGFLKDGFPIILFERHKFYKYMSQKLNSASLIECCNKNPDICNKEPGGYIGGKGEISKYMRASAINSTAAMASCSWGMFQILAANYKECGYSSVEEFVDAMMKSEKNHLHAFIEFIKSNNVLHQALIDKEWSTVARLYNGPAYLKNKYDSKMEIAYKQFS